MTCWARRSSSRKSGPSNENSICLVPPTLSRYEKYFKGYNQESIIPSFSMAKSVTSILIGCAIDDGLIKSIEEPITNYIPEMKRNGFEKVTSLLILNFNLSNFFCVLGCVEIIILFLYLVAKILTIFRNFFNLIELSTFSSL
jgi:hypothetical protein